MAHCLQMFKIEWGKICHKILLKLKLPFISEFRFDLAHVKMLNDTHMMVM